MNTLLTTLLVATATGSATTMQDRCSVTGTGDDLQIVCRQAEVSEIVAVLAANSSPTWFDVSPSCNNARASLVWRPEKDRLFEVGKWLVAGDGDVSWSGIDTRGGVDVLGFGCKTRSRLPDHSLFWKIGVAISFLLGASLEGTLSVVDDGNSGAPDDH